MILIIIHYKLFHSIVDSFSHSSIYVLLSFGYFLARPVALLLFDVFSVRMLILCLIHSLDIPSFFAEELAVTVDIVGQSSTSLPVASTCGQRLSMPLYESRKELRKKLLIAIECETYNLG